MIKKVGTLRYLDQCWYVIICIFKILIIHKMKSLMMCATKQHVGKTSASLGMFQKLLGKYDRVGYIKPVGQMTQISHGVQVDKDVKLFLDYFNIEKEWVQYMSPILLNGTNTRDYVDGKQNIMTALDHTVSCFNTLKEHNEFVLVEGTGHVGVGSIVNCNNAQIAKHLGTDMALVVSGGIGSMYDHLLPNVRLCEESNVDVKAIIVNKILPDKMDMVQYYGDKLLKPITDSIHYIPFKPDIDSLSMNHLERIFNTKLETTRDQLHNKFSNIELLVADRTHVDIADEDVGQTPLYILHHTRFDIIMNLFCHKMHSPHVDLGILMTGIDKKPTKYNSFIMHMAEYLKIPILFSNDKTITSYDKVRSYTMKPDASGDETINTIADHYAKYIDLKSMGI